MIFPVVTAGGQSVQSGINIYGTSISDTWCQVRQASGIYLRRIIRFREATILIRLLSIESVSRLELGIRFTNHIHSR